MRNITIIALLFFSFGFGQKHKSTVQCGYFGKLTEVQRFNTFPFNQARKVVLVSYPSELEIYEDEQGNRIPLDSMKIPGVIEKVSLPSDNEKGKKYLVKEKIELNKSQIAELSNLLLNYKMKGKPKVISVVNCYSPRNSILFLDENDKIISYVEVCFECSQFYQMPKQTIPDFNILCQTDSCNKMLGLIKEFFRKSGIHYGVD